MNLFCLFWGFRGVVPFCFFALHACLRVTQRYWFFLFFLFLSIYLFFFSFSSFACFASSSLLLLLQHPCISCIFCSSHVHNGFLLHLCVYINGASALRCFLCLFSRF